MNTTQNHQPGRAQAYRKTECLDGNAVRVHESRRRMHVAAGSSRSLPAHGPASPVAISRPILPNYVRRKPQNAALSSAGFEDQAVADVLHVTRKLLPSQSKPVILHQYSDSVRKEEVTNTNKKKTYQSSIPSPPPTPRFQRLPTPDLPELGQTPFCDCCISAHVVKFCASCGTGIERKLL
ncbi:hypothetical protein K432DRAFT_311203 [Lepidopterella palustris CBS 459.81]|uniref:Uncharacterized protein n=1 Tax=Lepidopterella palustris CBS 459.81 TaxID=1314670 RepID=A0A8E2DYW1_9PEZI|nr:hypothetical protein K432DRAFT_311203 [Lepidopterella palustris CBS 459.81]